MEPLSALSIATAVVQFLDFTANVVSGTCEIYKNSSDYAQRNIDIEKITTSLVSLNDDIRNSLSQSDRHQQSARDQQIEELAKRCNELGERVLAALQRLQPKRKPTLWTSFRLALRSIWSESEIESLEKTLEKYQRQISMLLLVSIR
jgi:hypothetical protein